MRDYPLPLRHIRYHDVQTSKTFNFLTNNFAIPAQTVADRSCFGTEYLPIVNRT